MLSAHSETCVLGTCQYFSLIDDESRQSMEKYAASTFRAMEAASEDRLNVHGMNVIIKWYLALYLLYHQTKIKTHSYEDYSSFKRYILLINNCFIQ